MTHSKTKAMIVGPAVAAALALAAFPVAAESSLAETYEGTHLSAGPNKPYVVNPPLSDATIEKRKDGYFSGTYGQVWVQPSKNEVAGMEKRRAGQSAQKWSNQ